MAGAIDDYLAFLHRYRAPTTAYDAEKRAHKHILPKLADIEVESLTTRQLRRWLNGLISSVVEDPEERRRKMDSANHCLTILKAALNRAYEDNQVQSADAWRRIKPFRSTTAARKVFLTEDEAQRLLNACHDPNLHDLVAAGLMTAARFGELAAMEVRDLSAGVWSVRQGKTGARETVLPSDAVPLFDRLTAGRAADALVFRLILLVAGGSLPPCDPGAAVDAAAVPKKAALATPSGT